MNDELKPCPACGASPEIKMIYDEKDTLLLFYNSKEKKAKIYYEVFCPECGYSGDVFAFRESAVKMWNEEETK